MSDRTANLKGKIVQLEKSEICAVIKTATGEALLDVSDALDYRLQLGDDIEVEDAGWYIMNGRIVTILGYKYRLNGLWRTIQEE